MIFAPDPFDLNPQDKQIEDARAALKNSRNTVSILARMVPDEGQIKTLFQWRSNLGEAFSPEFDDLDAAVAYPSANGLKIHEE